jgi:N-acetylneuraminate synthase
MKEYDIIDLHCKSLGIDWFASAWDGLSAHFINGYNIPCHKIASACLTDSDLLRRVRSNGKPVILSTGGSKLSQIQMAVEILGQEDLVILHCIADYPAKDEDINLSGINTFKNIFPGIPIGYSGHEADILPSLMAVAMGACVVERHVTLDKNMPGSDHKASLEPNELNELVIGIRRFEKLRGNGIKTVLPAEKLIMDKLRRKDTL